MAQYNEAGNIIQDIDVEEFIDFVIDYDSDNVPNVPKFNVEGIKSVKYDGHNYIRVELSIQV